MKRILLGITLLAFTAAVHAQKKPKAAPPAPAATAKPAPAAPAAPVAPAAPAPAAPTASGADESKLLVGVWGGYGFAGSSEFTKYPNDKFITDSQFAGSWSTKSDNKLGGVAGGLNLLYGSAFQYGIGLGYVTGMDNKTTHTTGSLTAVIATKVNYVPVYAQIRYFLIDGLYVGAGVGIASVVGSSQKITGDATAAVDYSGSQIVGVGKIGYDFKLSNSLSIGVVAGFYYFSGKIPVIFYDANNDPKTKEVDASHLNVIPALSVTYAF